MAPQDNRGISDEKRLELRQRRKRKLDEVEREPESKLNKGSENTPVKRPRNPKPRHVRKQYLINVPTTIRRDEELEGEKKMLAWRGAMEFAAENDDQNPDSDIDEIDGWTAKPGKIWYEDEDSETGIEVHTTTNVYGRIDYNARNGRLGIDLLGDDDDWKVDVLAENVDDLELENEQGDDAAHDMNVDVDIIS